jgi:hypothetical protein
MLQKGNEMNNDNDIATILALDENIPGLIDAVNETSPISVSFFDAVNNIFDTLILNATQRRELEAYLANQRTQTTIASVNAAAASARSNTWATAFAFVGAVVGVYAVLKPRKS